MKRALINIDYTYDFVAEKGALTCGKPGQEIEKELVHITKRYIENGITLSLLLINMKRMMYIILNQNYSRLII